METTKQMPEKNIMLNVNYLVKDLDFAQSQSTTITYTLSKTSSNSQENIEKRNCLVPGMKTVILKKIMNNNKKFRSFKSKENIHKKVVGPYHGFGFEDLKIILSFLRRVKVIEKQ